MKTSIINKININNISIPENPEIEKKLIMALFIAILLSAILYGYLIKEAVISIVLRDKIGEEMGDLSSKVSNLEVEYIELKNKIDLDFAYSKGFKEVTDIKFVSRNNLGRTLTIKNQSE